MEGGYQELLRLAIEIDELQAGSFIVLLKWKKKVNCRGNSIKEAKS